MKARAELSLQLPNEETAEAVFQALSGEEEKKERFETKITLKDNRINILIVAEDIVALRATLNSYLRYLQVMEREINDRQKD